MSRTRTVVLSAVTATAVVAAIAWGASTTMAAGGSNHPTGQPPTVDDSVFPAAPGLTADDSGSDQGSDGSGTNGDRAGHRGFGHGMRMGGMGMGGMLGMGGGLLHGEGVVKDRDGSYVTVATQSGAVTAVSGSSVTVKSDDGYARTWALTDDTKYWGFPDQPSKSDLKAGVAVRIAGTVDGSTATARLVVIPPKPGSFPKPSWTPGQSGAPHPWGSDRPAPHPWGSDRPAPKGSDHPAPAPSASASKASA